MTAAFLILAHRQPAQLRRLIARLAHPAAAVLVHLDAKADRAAFEGVLDSNARAAFLPDRQRVAINWCGFSMVRATLALLRAAYAAGAERFVLLSGADYPARPLPDILAQLAIDRELIAVDRRCDPAGDGWFDRCAYRRFFGDVPLLNPRAGAAPWARIGERLAGRLPRRHYELPVYYGSAWWSLTRAAVGEVLAFADGRPALVDWFKLARSPDEMVFQTILKQSSRAASIAGDATFAGVLPPPRVLTHFADFEGSSSGSPATLTGADLDRIIASKALFARKFDPLVSAELLDELDRRFHTGRAASA